ncbi:NAD(P)H-binding protein [Cronobacter sakazakii]|uniref:NAD(P)H-binding protein n=4 Tax=Cronobacter sakazakii TaxID=28141 RepID=A0AAN6AW76_CROSK|nr:NAD(P)H-binding protein [Cronobacter sakazakii]EGT4276267.1 NAD-dependent epimerase/dehydratase family protein [Cronobacter sakazakii]EGT5693508.1 NAD-dependent epimerase/dehydratase family protein [Cronobacter sakazakii]EGT5701655.1 NAD-dependent epimerase/dehydratase family protein [Cronobacter sakazakii]EGT5719455.1 NAD-dependent epimerase/dehydratase family protein [Cronobacter sakazakii]EGT5724508.1 NAD-dependent epimerase/dehydratase family protein [Cronobacter sakazakii]
MSRVLITGASGLVGSHLLRMLVDEPRVTSIIAPTRRPLRVPMHKVENPCDPQLSDVLTQLSAPLDIVFCCLGTTRREAGSKEAFILADYTLVVDTSLAGLRLGAKHMLVVSALGANPNSPFFYNRVKGEMETALKAQGWPRLTIARPSLLIGDREKRRAGESFMAPLFRLLPGKWKAIEAHTVAQAMVNAALSPAKEDVTVLDSAQLREIAAQTAR